MYFITTKRMLEVCFFQHTPTFIIEPKISDSSTAKTQRTAGDFSFVINKSAHHAEKTDDFTEDLYVIQDDRVHRGVFRLETEVTVLFVERFYGRGVINERYDFIAVLGVRLLCNDDFITAVDPGFDHTVSFYL